MTAMTHKEMTAHIRNRIKHEGIKARVRLQKSCGSKWIQVFTPRFDIRFSAEEAKKIAFIADCNGLTFARGLAVDPTIERWQNGEQEFNFVYRP